MRVSITLQITIFYVRCFQNASLILLWLFVMTLSISYNIIYFKDKVHALHNTYLIEIYLYISESHVFGAVQCTVFMRKHVQNIVFFRLLRSEQSLVRKTDVRRYIFILSTICPVHATDLKKM